MAVGFRSFLSVDPGEPVIEGLVKHLGRWLAQKHINIPVDSTGCHSRNENDVITVLRERHQDGGMYRWRRHHPFATGAYEMYRTTVTAFEGDDGGWLWTEIETPSESDLESSGGPKHMSVPAFLRSLLGELSFRDGRTPAPPEPQWIAQHHLPDLMDYLADETRRGSVYLMSQGGRPSDEFESWAREAAWPVAGLGAPFLLEEHVERDFNEMVGIGHSIRPGTVRTFQPNVNLDDQSDPERHRMLSKLRITTNTPRYIGYILGTVQRDHAARLPLPDHVLEINRVLGEREREIREQAGNKALRLVTPTEPLDSAPHGHVPDQTETAALIEQRMSPAELATEVVRLRAEAVELQRLLACHQSAYEEMHAVLRTQADQVKAIQARTRSSASNGQGRMSAS